MIRFQGRSCYNSGAAMLKESTSRSQGVGSHSKEKGHFKPSIARASFSNWNVIWKHAHRMVLLVLMVENYPVIGARYPTCQFGKVSNGIGWHC